MFAEQAYLFRHALLRDAAYQLQLPTDRAGLHGVAYEVILGLSLDEGDSGVDRELADHARAASERGGATGRRWLEREADHLRKAAQQASDAFDLPAASQLYARLGDHPLLDVSQRALALAKAGDHFRFAGDAEAALSVLRRAQALEGINVEARATVQSSLGLTLYPMGNAKEALPLLDDALAIMGEAWDEQRRLTMQGEIAEVHRVSGHVDLAETLLLPALQTARERGFKAVEVRLTQRLGLAYIATGRALQAESLLASALGDARQLNLVRDIGGIENALAMACHYTGRPEQAAVHYRAALAQHRSVGMRLLEGVALGNLGAVLRETGKLEEAESILREACAMHVEMGNKRSYAICYGNLGLLYWDLGRLADAERVFREELEMYLAMGMPQQQSTCLNSIALILEETGRLDAARELYGESISIGRRLRDSQGLVIGLTNLGSVQVRMRLAEEARATLKEALELARAIQDVRSQGFAYQGLAELSQLLGLTQCADRCWKRAIESFASVSDPQKVAQSRCALASLWLMRGRHEEARREHGAALSVLAGEKGVPDRVTSADPLGVRLCVLRGDLTGAREYVSEMSAFAKLRKLTAGDLVSMIEASRAVIDAARTGGALWHGFVPGELSPLLRVALVDEERAGAASAIEPRLLEAMLEVTRAVHPPDWRTGEVVTSVD